MGGCYPFAPGTRPRVEVPYDMDTDMLYYTVKIRIHPNATQTFVVKTTNEALDQIRTYIRENVV